MDWHTRYTQQAGWTRELRNYLFASVGLEAARRTLEVGCGTGAILCEINSPALHGLDLQPASLMDARVHAPAAALTRGDALSLPYADGAFDITFCHFLLLWVSDVERALLEMKRVTRAGGYVLALAEPDYSARVDKPAELAELGRLQTESLRKQGADPSVGGSLAGHFFRAGIKLIETGTIESRRNEAPTLAEWKSEWAVLEDDLAESVPFETIQHFKRVDKQAWERGERILHVPTHFAYGQVET